MNDCKLIYVGFAFLHHKGTHAGYNQIAEYLHYDYKINAQTFIEKASRKKNLPQKILGRIIRFFTSFSNIPFFCIKCIKYGHKHPNAVFHFIYGENLLNNLKPFLNNKNKIVCTFHQPFTWFENNPKFLKLLNSLDAIILVGNAEIEKFEMITGRKNVYFIPHGICTDFYKPINTIKKEHMLLTVGNWLRDYNFANDVYEKLLMEDSNLEIHIVTNRENHSRIKKHSRIHLHCGISDNQLRDLYCRSSVLYLPLIRYTANNALLEAGATGCNIVISSNYPDNSYIPNQYIFLTKMDVDQAVTAIKQAIKHSYNKELSQYIHNHFSWTKIAAQTEEILKSI